MAGERTSKEDWLETAEAVGRESGENSVSEVKGVERFLKRGVVVNVCSAKSSITRCLNRVHGIMYFANHCQPQGEQFQWKGGKQVIKQ